MAWQPSRARYIEDGTFKLVDGIWHKRCKGPSHPEPVYLPATEKYFTPLNNPKTRNRFESQCRLCRCWKRLGKTSGDLEHGLVPVSEVIQFYEEAVNRIGLMELARRTGLTYWGISDVLYRRRKSVQKRNLKKVLLELVSARRKNEVNNNPNSKYFIQRRGNPHDARYCSGCGVLITEDAQTEGCKQCIDRLAFIKRRADPKKRARDNKYQRNRKRSKRSKKPS